MKKREQTIQPTKYALKQTNKKNTTTTIIKTA